MSIPKPAPSAFKPAKKNEGKHFSKKKHPTKSKRGQQNRRQAQKEQVKLHVYLIDLPNGETVEFRAPADLELLDVGVLYREKNDIWPMSVKKKPFTPTEHLQNRPFARNEDLIKLKNQLQKEGGR